VAAPDDVEGIGNALAELEGSWRAGRLDGTPLSEEWRQRLSRRARAEDYASFLEEVAR
jgi:hypothetical protein